MKVNNEVQISQNTPNSYFVRGSLYHNDNLPSQVYLCCRGIDGPNRLYNICSGNIWSSHPNFTAGLDDCKWTNITNDYVLQKVKS